jgi:hypothetical protein
VGVLPATLGAFMQSIHSNRKCPLFSIHEISDLFGDACVQDTEGKLIFLSVYGRDTSLAQFYAAMQLGSHDGGIRSFKLTGESLGGEKFSRTVAVGEVDDLDKHHGQIPCTLFGKLSQAFVFQKRAVNIDKANGTAVLLYPRSERSLGQGDRLAIKQQLWSLVQQLSPVAVLDRWQEVLFAECPSLWQSFGESNYPPIGEISAWRVQLPSAFSAMISDLIRSHRLKLE